MTFVMEPADKKFESHHRLKVIQELDFGVDTCRINRYIKKRMQNNGISKIMDVEGPDNSLVVYSLLQPSQPTSASVQKSFSMLRKLFAKDKNLRSKI